MTRMKTRMESLEKELREMGVEMRQQIRDTKASMDRSITEIKSMMSNMQTMLQELLKDRRGSDLERSSAGSSLTEKKEKVGQESGDMQAAKEAEVTVQEVVEDEEEVEEGAEGEDDGSGDEGGKGDDDVDADGKEEREDDGSGDEGGKGDDDVDADGKEERERRMDFVPDISVIKTENIEVDKDSVEKLAALGMGDTPGLEVMVVLLQIGGFGRGEDEKDADKEKEEKEMTRILETLRHARERGANVNGLSCDGKSTVWYQYGSPPYMWVQQEKPD